MPKITTTTYQINTISSQLDQTKKLFDAGRGTVTDIYENEANLNSIGARRIEALNVIKNDQYELKRYTGSTEENIFKLNNQDINLNFIEKHYFLDVIIFFALPIQLIGPPAK